ncbi:MAG: T9SS type A sorting domain-containing protein [Bacteroidia bacterium]
MKKLLLVPALLFFIFINTDVSKASQWNQLNGPYGAYVPQIAVSNGYIYISCEINQSYGGVHRSNNNGASWTDISSGLPMPRAQSIAATGDTVYVCSDTNIFISINNGTVWTDIKNNLPVYSYPIKVFLHNGILFSVVYYGTGYSELFYSTNTGITWTTTGFTIGSSASVYSFTSDGNKLYAATFGYGVQVSGDNGLTWVSMSNNIPFSAGIYSIFAHGDTLYAGTTNNTYISTDGANLWMPANNGLPPTNHVFCFAIYGNTVYAGTLDDGVYTTTLGSSTWTAATNGTVPYNQSMQLAINGTSIISAGNNGVYVSPLPSINWTLSNNGLLNAYIYTLFADGQKVFANVGTYLGLYLSTDGGNTWAPTTIVNNNYVLKIMKYGSTYFALTAMGLYSSSNGSVWAATGTGFVFQSPVSIIATGNKLLAGTSGDGVYSSIDGGLNWNKSATGLPANSTITSMAVSGATVYANHNNKGVYVSYDAGETWNAINAGLPQTSYYTTVVVNQGCILTLCYSGLYRSCDGGVSWQLLTSPFYINDIAVRNNLLFGIDYNGVEVSDDNGSHWHNWSEGLSTYINQLNKIYIDGNNVYLGTQIASVWKRSLTPELITTSIGGSPYCSGDVIAVNFTSTTTYNAGNKFFVELSDSSGNFTNAVIIDSLAAVTPATINAHIPDTMATGTHYRVRVYSTSPYVINTDNGNDIAIFQKPAIWLQPANQTTCDGNGSGFFCGAKGSGIIYQWQVDNGGGYTNLSNNATYQNVNSDLLLILIATPSMDGYKYRCIVSGTCTPNVTSNFATLTVNSPAPAITSQPADQTVCALNPATFTVTASGLGLTYKWEENNGSGFFSPLFNGGQYSGVTTNTLTINNIGGNMDGYQYHCVISNCTESNAATLNVNGVPTAPVVVDANVCDGSTAYFIANISGANLTFQWEENNGSGYTTIINGGNYAGATTQTLLISNVSLAIDGYQYRCQVTGVCAPFTSQTNDATLTINTNPPSILQQPNDSAVCEHSNVKFALQASTPLVFYAWQMNTGSGWNNLTDVPPFSGVNTDTLSIDTVSILFNNYHFRCKVSDCATSDSVTLTVYAFPVVTLNPFSNVCVFAPLVTLTGASPTGGNYYGTAISNNQFNPAVSGTGTFAIEYLYTSPNGCTGIASQNITVDACINVGINEQLVTENNFSLYPNPAKDVIHVKANFESASIVQLTITNIFGAIIFEKSLGRTDTVDETINSSQFKNGMYFLVIWNEIMSESEKFVVMH